MSMSLPKGVLDALRFEEKILPNGLCLRVLPMPEYHAAHVIYATNFGSIHRVFEKDGKKVTLPAGIAHFLEHKMFENEDGVDAFTLYAATGASANAYTGFDRTSYIFTATERIEENLDILLGFVGHPHFTKATVDKEQGIIGQEIMMYEDNADLRVVFGMLEGLYHNHPVRDEIVGTVDTIADITPEVLYSCTDAFYTPANMALCAAGNITMAQLEAAVERAQLPRQRAEVPKVLFDTEPATVAKARQETKMSVALPLFAVGYKEAPSAGATLHTEVVCDMLGELLCGEGSTLYRRLYDEGLVQPGFGADFGCLDECLYMMFGGEGPDPARVQAELVAEIERQRKEGVDPQQFATCKAMMYGDAVADLESVERVASMLAGSYFHGRTPAEELQAVAALRIEDVNAALQTMLLPHNSTFMQVYPTE